MAVLIVLASFLSIALSKLRLPSLVGFLITGIIIANYIAMPEGTGDVVSIFSNLGLIMLMFTIGLEIDIYKLKIQGRFALIIAIVQIPVMVVAGILTGMAFGYSTVQCIVLGAILSGASTAVVLAVLKANEVLDQEKMEILIIVMIIEGMTQVILISILTPMMQGDDMSADALIVLMIHIALFLGISFTLGLKVVPKLIDWFYERSNDELIALLCIGLLFVFSFLANRIGLSVAIGAFISGVMVGLSRPKHNVEHFVDPLKTLFMAMFFISVGAEVSVDSLLQNIPMILTIYLIFACCIFVAVNIGYWFANGDSRSGWVSAAAMCTMGEFAFIISKEALGFGVFDTSLYSSVVGAAIVSMVLLPMLVRASDRTYGMAGRICPHFLKRIGWSLTKKRDLVYGGLAVVSYRSRERFNKGLTNSVFLMALVVLIEVVFYLIYTPLSSWLTENFGLDNHTWRVTILFFNIIILLFPCRRLAGFMRYTLYIVDRGREYYNTHHYGPVMEKRISDAFSTLAIGAAMDVLIVLIVPNGIETRYHVALLLVVLALSIFYQWHMFRKEAEKVEPPIENEDLLSEEEIV